MNYQALMYHNFVIEDLIKIFIETGKFSAQDVMLTTKTKEDWVQFRIDPQRFLPKIFDGDWARADKKPSVGPIRLVRIMVGNDGVHRVIGRQQTSIYATPWIGK
jgi:hypothetical protein